MVLRYKFKKEKLKDGTIVSRPKILVSLKGDKGGLDVFALIDSGCDTTVIPEGIARFIGLDMSGKKIELMGHKELSKALMSRLIITLESKNKREEETLTIPVLIVLEEEGKYDSDIVLGIDGLFDKFDIIFKKSSNRIIFKKNEGKIYLGY